MRHSSWTLFLVPLALAAFILIMPEALKVTNQPESRPQEAVETLWDDPAAVSEAANAEFGSGGDTFQDSPESLYKE
jgi:hypothetical protein